MAWHDPDWVPHDAPVGAGVGETLVTDGDHFGLAFDDEGQVVLAYPVDTSEGRRVVVQHHQ
jgi:hypothetical protein